MNKEIYDMLKNAGDYANKTAAIDVISRTQASQLAMDLKSILGKYDRFFRSIFFSSAPKYILYEPIDIFLKLIRIYTLDIEDRYKFLLLSEDVAKSMFQVSEYIVLTLKDETHIELETFSNYGNSFTDGYGSRSTLKEYELF